MDKYLKCGILFVRAAQFNNLEEAARIYSDAMEIDPRNKGTNAKILASRAEVYAKVPVPIYLGIPFLLKTSSDPNYNQSDSNYNQSDSGLRSCLFGSGSNLELTNCVIFIKNRR